MALKDKIQIIERHKITDHRGWFLKVITGKEDGLPAHTGEVYLISAHPGETRANHYHKEANEWFTLIQGTADLILEDIHTKEQMVLKLDSNEPTTVFVPNNIAHAFQNTSTKPYLLIAYSDRLYEAVDTTAYKMTKSIS